MAVYGRLSPGLSLTQRSSASANRLAQPKTLEERRALDQAAKRRRVDEITANLVRVGKDPAAARARAIASVPFYFGD